MQERGPELAEASLADGREAKVPDPSDGLLWEVYREDGPCWDPLEQLFSANAPLSRQASADSFTTSLMVAG